MVEPVKAPEKAKASRGRRARAKLVRPAPLKLVLASIAPAACLVWFMLTGEEKRREILARLPEGAADRALHAAVAFGVLAALAWLLLPCVYAVLVGTRRLARWFRDRSGRGRVLLAPVRLVAVVLHAAAGFLFFTHALLILIALLTTGLTVVWIGFPAFLGGEEQLRAIAGRLAESVGVTF